MPPVVCIDLARAGAMTSANRIGVRSGTTISRGVCALSANRRLDSVANGESMEMRGRFGCTADGRTLGMVVVTVDMWGSFVWWERVPVSGWA